MRWIATGVAAGVALAACGGGGLDGHAKTACGIVRNLDAGGAAGTFDKVVDEVRATAEAKRSSNAALRHAANKTSAASGLSSDSPLYENPGDVQYNAVAAWCRQH